jgi:acetylxylan esterase
MKSIFTAWNLHRRTQKLAVLLLFLSQLSSPANAGTFKEITDFSSGGKNPTGLKMFLYTPSTVKTNPAVLVGIHWCHGYAKYYCDNTRYKTIADKYGFLVIYPNANSSDSCFDVHSPGTLHHDSTGDACGIVSMVNYTIKTYQADSNRVFATGHSSGGMMTIVLMGSYPDVFKAGSASADVPFGCFAGENTWNSDCADGKISKTGKEWGDLVRAAYPGYTGPRPRIQLWHGANDGTLNAKNFDEDIKQWIDVLGLNATPATSQLTLKIDNTNYTYSRCCYANNSNGVMLDAIKAIGQDHNCKISEDSVVAFFGLNKITSVRDQAMDAKGFSCGASMTLEKSSSGNLYFAIASQPGRITIDLYNLSRAKIKTIANRNSPAGILRLSWNAVADNGRPIPAGMYVLSLKVNGASAAAYRTPVFVGNY